MENTEVPSQSKLEKCDSPSSCSYESEISLGKNLDFLFFVFFNEIIQYFFSSCEQ